MLVTPSALVMGLEVAAVRVDLLEEEEEEEEEESALLRLFRPLLAVAANVDMGGGWKVGVSGWVVVEEGDRIGIFASHRMMKLISTLVEKSFLPKEKMITLILSCLDMIFTLIQLSQF